MKQSNATQPSVVQHAVAERLSAASDVHAAYIGLDVHKASISVAIAEPGRQAPEFRGEIPHEPKAIDTLIRQLSERFAGQPLLFSYEAGPCGYGVYHQVQASGHDGEVVAPSLIPPRAGDRVKTARRDAKMLARLSRSGELTPVWVPTPEQEAMRGVSLITAMTVLAELGDISRFDSPRQLMAYLGLVPSEHSSGGSRRQGGITKTGNGYVRRVLVESAWSYRFPARKTRIIQQRAEKTSPAVQAIAWEAQKRLCGRYRDLTRGRKNTKLFCVEVARELVGFIWDIVYRAMARVTQDA
jgi:transposase